MAYEVHTWSTCETITADRLNAIEGGIADATDEVTSATATTLEAGSNATASLSGGVLTLGIPKGDKGDKGDTGDKGDKGDKGDTGDTGTAATVQVGTVTSGATASVTNSGTSSAAVFDFVLPKGEDGASGTVISNVVVSVDGTYSATPTATGSVSGDTLTLGFTGLRGASGDKGEEGAAATVTVGSVTTGEAGTGATVTNSGTTAAAVLDFAIPKGDTGEKGDTGAYVNGISLTVTDGVVTAGRASLSDGNSFDIVITTETAAEAEE